MHEMPTTVQALGDQKNPKKSCTKVCTKKSLYKQFSSQSSSSLLMKMIYKYDCALRRIVGLATHLVFGCFRPFEANQCNAFGMPH